MKKQKIEHVSNEEEKLKNICKKPNEGGIPPLPVEIWETIFEYVTQQEGAVPFLLKVWVVLFVLIFFLTLLKPRKYMNMWTDAVVWIK